MKGKTFRFFFTFSKVLLLIKGKTFRLLKQKKLEKFYFLQFLFLVCVGVNSDWVYSIYLLLLSS
jgi:hypothetical protein